MRDPINYFNQIYQAALRQDERLLPPEGTDAIDEFKQGNFGMTAATQLALEGKIDAVEWLIQRGANINWAAYGAAQGGHIDFTKTLIEEGADINWVAKGAALGGHVDFAKSLIEQGANINAVAYGAALGGHVDFAKTLIEQGANINAVAKEAALGGHVDFANELIQQGADINEVAQGAAQGGHVDFANELIQQDTDINQLAASAALGGHSDFANELIQQDADINQVATFAALGGHSDFANELIQQGASIDVVAMCAARGGHVDLANELLKQDANIDAVAYGAALGDQVNFAKTLIEKGANINKLTEAIAAGGHVDFAYKLYQRGADINCVAQIAAKARRLHTEEQQLSFLSRFENQTTRHGLVDALQRLQTSRPITIEPATLKRVDRIGRLWHDFAYPYSLALASTQACTLQNSDNTTTNTGALVMIAAAACFQNRYPLPRDEKGQEIQIALPPEIWRGIFEFVFECELSQDDLQQLGFFTGRFVLIKQLDDYRKSLWFWQKDKKANVDSLKNSALRLSNVRELREFVSSKTEHDENDNDAASTSIAQQQQTIFMSWHKRLKQDDSDATNCGARATPA